MEWQPIESAPKDGFFLVHEDGAIRTMMRDNGKWTSPAIAALVGGTWGEHVVGSDVQWLVPKGYRLEVLEICDQPTHWMPLPAALRPVC